MQQPSSRISPADSKNNGNLLPIPICRRFLLSASRGFQEMPATPADALQSFQETRKRWRVNAEFHGPPRHFILVERKVTEVPMATDRPFLFI